MKKHIDVAEMVNRFLAWKLPQGFAPDGGISFKPSQNGEHAFWPIGTNLLTAEQARQMFEHCLGEALAQPQGEPLYRCKSCGGVYIEPPTQCDCMPDVQEYDIGSMSFGDTPVVQQGKQQDVNQIEAMVNLHDAAFVHGFAAGKLYGQANPEPQEPVAWMLEQGGVVEFEYRDYHENSEWTPLYTAPPSAALPVPDHLPDATKMVGCAYCDNPLFAGMKCNNCGRVTLALPVQEPVAWRVRGYNQFKTGNPASWRYVDGAYKPSVNNPDCCDFEPLYAAPVRTKDLTDDEIMKINADTAGIVPTCDRQFHFARAVIAKLREKERLK